MRQCYSLNNRKILINYKTVAIQTHKQTLRVILWGKEIGQLTWDAKRNISYFFFSPDYFKQSYDISPIMYPKSLPESGYAIYGDKYDPIYQKLPPFIADSLPDRWGNYIFDEWFNTMNYRQSDKTPITKLSFIGETAMGALEFRPILNNGISSKEVNLFELYREAKSLEAKLNGMKVDETNFSKENLIALGTSPGGSRSKAIISQRPDGVYVSGKTATDPTYRHYIIKFNTEIHSLGETEMTYQQMALLSGIDIMPSKLIDINGIKNFTTERFDRQNGEKVFMQTLAAINQCDETYEDLFKTGRLLNLGAPQMEEMFRRTAFNFLMNNTDDHRKNFSFIMDKDGTWRIAPAYDITFILETGNTPCERHCMSLNGKRDGINRDDLLVFAKENGINNAEKIIDKIVAASLSFKELAHKNGIRSDIQEIIENKLIELRPDNFAKISLEPSLTFLSKTGALIQNAHFERGEKGNIHLIATINGRQKKYILTPKRKEYSEILKFGFNSMKDEIKKSYFEKLLFKKSASLKFDSE